LKSCFISNIFIIIIFLDPNGQIGQALLLGRLDAAVEMCFKQNMMADALLLAMTGGPELLARTQERYFKVEAALFVYRTALIKLKSTFRSNQKDGCRT
jgi:hypothetical protein